MIQERWGELDRKFAPLGITFDQAEFASIRCLRCSAILADWVFYCAPCLQTSDAGALEYLKIQEALCLAGKMLLLGVVKKTEGYCSPSLSAEFEEFIREYQKRDYEATGIERIIGFKSPDAMNFFRFYLGNAR